MAVAKPITIEEFMNDYEQIRTPDFARIADYVNYAKGNEKNMAQFADATGIGASTLSRIVNGRSTKPLSKETIVKIYEARADRDAVMLLDMLARANGMFPREFAERVKVRDRYEAKRNEEINREHMMKNALIANIVSSGMPIAQVINSPHYRCPEVPLYIPRKRGDFVLQFPPSAEDPKVAYSWTFFLFPHIHDELDDERHLSLPGLVKNIIERTSGWFVMDAWDIDVVIGDKFSFCFVDEEIFNLFFKTLQVAKLKTEMTVMLLNQTTYAVEKEVWLPGTYSKLYEEDLFIKNTPNNGFVSDDNDDEEDDE